MQSPLSVATFPRVDHGWPGTLAIPIWAGDKLEDRLAGLPDEARKLVHAAAENQGFEGEAGAFLETFIEDERHEAGRPAS